MSHIGKKYRFLKKYVCILVGLWLRSKPNLAFSKNLSLDPLVALPMEKIPRIPHPSVGGFRPALRRAMENGKMLHETRPRACHRLLDLHPSTRLAPFY